MYAHRHTLTTSFLLLFPGCCSPFFFGQPVFFWRGWNRTCFSGSTYMVLSPLLFLCLFTFFFRKGKGQKSPFLAILHGSPPSKNPPPSIPERLRKSGRKNMQMSLPSSPSSSSSSSSSTSERWPFSSLGRSNKKEGGGREKERGRKISFKKGGGGGGRVDVKAKRGGGGRQV